MRLTDILLLLCGIAYGALAVVVTARSRRTAPLLLGLCCAVTAGWAMIVLAVPGDGQTGIEGGADLVRALAWFCFVLYLYRDARFAPASHVGWFVVAGVAAGLMGAVAVVLQPWDPVQGVARSMLVFARLGVAVLELLLIENLYLNLPEHSRWHVALPTVLLGGLACFDVVLTADAALFSWNTQGLTGARTVGMILIGPFLAVAAARGQRWRGPVRMSRAAAFRSATLVLCGGVLLVLSAVGALVQWLDADWGWLVEASLGFAALIAIGLALTSGSIRSRIQRGIVDHFFAERYDYKREWLTCMRSLSGEEGPESLAIRAIRTVASVVDSPAGLLLLRDDGAGPLTWAGSWNMPACGMVPADHTLVLATQGGSWIPRLDEITPDAPLAALGPLWLAVPLLRRGALTGLVLIAPPRAPFGLELEVFQLLRIVAQEVSTYLGEQRATQTLLQTQALHEYGKRFSFVAHDIKNVSSQLSLLLVNAQHHIANPAFQTDMLQTVEASVSKIGGLLRRLENPTPDRAPGPVAALPVVDAVVSRLVGLGRQLVLEHDGSVGAVAMGAEALETALTHLLNNAIEASGTAPVLVRVRHEAGRVVVEVIDAGPGMAPEFVRDALFEPFSTSRSGGSGLGAFQSRELVREAGGDLEVSSASGKGTTIRLLLPRTDARGLAALGEAAHG